MALAFAVRIGIGNSNNSNDMAPTIDEDNQIRDRDSVELFWRFIFYARIGNCLYELRVLRINPISQDVRFIFYIFIISLFTFYNESISHARENIYQ